jgi:arsenite-transporting ATPase
VEAAASTAKSQLLSFQLQMYDLEDMFSDAELTEFLIVTVPTELAARESIRLLNDLTFEDPDMPIKVRNIVVNQVLIGENEDAKSFLEHVASTQKGSIDNLSQSMAILPSPPRITKAQYLDTEPRGVFGLKVFADELTK